MGGRRRVLGWLCVVLIAGLATALMARESPARQAGATPGVVADVFPPDYLQVGKVVYFPRGSILGRPLEASDLGPEVARVKTVEQGPMTLGICSSIHNFPDDSVSASFLALGTPVHAVVGYAPWFRLAVERDGALVAFEAGCAAGARTGADLLDIDGKVARISVQVSDGRVFHELAVFTDPAEVDRLVGLMLSAPIDRAFGASMRPEERGQPYVVAFHLADGTVAARGYWPATGELQQWIAVPPEFEEAIDAAVSRAGTPVAQSTPGIAAHGSLHGR